MPKAKSGENSAPEKAPRLVSLDALRGADMLCIIGLDALFYQLYRVFPQSETAQFLARQFGHKAWEGLAIYDVIFPLFVFVSGAAMAFSLEKKRSRGESTARQTAELFRRGLILALIGFILQGGLSFHFSDVRFASVLALIGLANAIGGSVAVLLKSWKKVFAGALCLSLAVAFLQIFGGDFTPENSLNAKLDRAWLPGKLHDGILDPEGILCVVSASVSVLFGFLAGTLVRAEAVKNFRKPFYLALAGTALLGIAWLADAAGYPIIKKLWTQSFVFAAGGWSLIAFAIFYGIFDVCRMGKLAFFFRIIGVNALAIYVLQWLVNFAPISNLLFGGIAELCGSAAPLILAGGTILLKWLLLYWLNRKAIFLKIG